MCLPLTHSLPPPLPLSLSLLIYLSLSSSHVCLPTTDQLKNTHSNNTDSTKKEDESESLRSAPPIPTPSSSLRGYSSSGDSSVDSDTELEGFRVRTNTEDRVGLCKLKDTISHDGNLNSKVIRLEVRDGASMSNSLSGAYGIRAGGVPSFPLHSLFSYRFSVVFLLDHHDSLTQVVRPHICCCCCCCCCFL